MATALQKQLASIQANRRNELDLKAQKVAHARSLLFEPQVAATQSFEVIYQLCREGFDELCALDGRFARYANTLFSPTSKSQERDLMTERENQELDIVLQNFFSLVGARILLKPAQEATEWLIRRFQVHERNTEPLVLTFLPYYGHPIFLTLLSILPSKLPPSLRFLYRYTNAFSNPPRDALVQASIRNPSFFSALNTYVLRNCRNDCQYPALISLWAGLIAQSIDTRLSDAKSGMAGVQQQKNEDILSIILPILNEALAITNATELTVGCHLILLVLVGRLDLDDKALDTIMSAVAMGLRDETRDTAVACLSVLAERKQISSLPKAVLKKLLFTPGLDRCLKRLSKEQNLRKLILGLVAGFTESIAKQPMNEAVGFFKFLEQSNLLSPEEKQAAFQFFLISPLSHKTIDPEKIDVGMQREIDQIHGEIKSIALRCESSAPVPHSPISKLLPESVSIQEDSGTEKDCYSLALDHVAQEHGFDPKKKSKKFHNVTFIGLADDSPFDQLAVLFEAATTSAATIEAFCALPVFQSTSLESHLTLFTFLAAFWCSQYPVESRAAALRTVTGILDKMLNTTLDMQILIPYVLCALSDGNRTVRGNATELVTVLSRMNPPRGTVPWGQAIFSGKTPSFPQWLSTKDSSIFIKQCLLPNLEECLVDSSRIGTTLRQLFEKSNSNEGLVYERVLGKDQKLAIFSFLCKSGLSNSSQTIRLRLLRLLNNIDNISGSPRSHVLLPSLKEFVARFSDYALKCSKENVDLESMTQEMFRTASPNHDEAVMFVCNVAIDDSVGATEDIQLAAFHRIQNFWQRIPPKPLSYVITALMKASISTSTARHGRIQASNILRSRSIPNNILLSLINETLLDSSSTSSLLPTKKRRTQQGAAPISQKESEEDTHLNKLTLVLEMVEASKNKGDPELFKSMFKVLQELQSQGMQANSDMTYLTNLTLTSLSQNMVVLKENTESRQAALNSARPDLLVDCVRHTSSPQNRASALLVLSFLAKQAPQIVLQSVMPIFTMMSVTTARLSDEFSAHVVDQTIEDVMPVLVQKLHEEKKDLVSATAEILLSFAAAFDHIPPHRRLKLFKLLATTLGPDESLFAIITALVDAYPANDEVTKFATTLCREFGTAVSMSTISNILHLILEGTKSGLPRASLFQKLTQEHASLSGREHAALNLMNNVLDLLCDPSFRRELRIDLNSDENSAAHLETSLQNSFETVFKIFNPAQPSMKQESSQVLEQLLSLFPFESMIRAMQPLLQHSEESICKSILRTLEARITPNAKTDTASKTSALELLPSLTSILKTDHRSGLRPHVLACIDQICGQFGRVNPAVVLETMEVMSGVHCIGSEDIQVQTIAFYCLASSLDVLQDGFIPLLKSVEITACSSLQTSIQGHNEKLHNAIVAFFVALTDTIPYMISEESLKTLLRLSQESALSDFSLETHENRNQLLMLLAKKVEMPITTRLILQVWPDAVAKGLPALRDLVDMIKAIVDSHGKNVVSRYSRNLFELFLEALDLRRQVALGSKRFSRADSDMFERMIIDALLVMVLKINDAIFRPFFVQVLEWSSAVLSKRDTETKHQRTITIFNLLFALSERLKFIFTPYYNYVVEQASECLRDESSSFELRSSVLRALTSSFRHDNDDFWQSPSHFDPLVEGLSAQFSKNLLQRIQPELILAFTELAVAASSNEHHKDMNGRLLKSFRSDSAKTRLAGVKCQQSLTERLGDEWLSNLPEMLPSINELQEDDDEEVEKETHRWIKLIEDKLGESLNSMLQ